MPKIVRRSSTPYPNSKKCHSFIPSSPDCDSSPNNSQICSLQMNSSINLGSEVMNSMDSPLPESEFLSFYAARKVSFKVQSGDRDSRVAAGTSVSPATPVFHTDLCKAEAGLCNLSAMPCSLIVSSVPISIPQLESEQPDVQSATGVLASSNIGCERLDSAAIGCPLDSAGFIPVESPHVHVGNLSAKDSGEVLLPGDCLCVSRHGSQRDDIAQQAEHGECVVAPLFSAVDCNSLVSPLRSTQQSPQRSVAAVPNSDARSGLSMKHVEGPKDITWSSLVTKNTLRGHDYMEVDQSSRWLMVLP